MLHPDLIRAEWTNDEDLQLLNAVREHGMRWSFIAEQVFNHTRCDVWCRSRFVKLKHNKQAKRKLNGINQGTLVIDNDECELVVTSVKNDDVEILEQPKAKRRRIKKAVENTETEKRAEPPLSPMKQEKQQDGKEATSLVTVLEQFLGELVYQPLFDE